MVAKLGFASSLISVPAGFILTILVSLVAERMKGEIAAQERGRAQELVEGMHGWAQVTRRRYDSSTWLLILAAMWAPILLWGLVPW